MTSVFIQEIDINKKDQILEKYDFNYTEIIKEYKINNVIILFTKNKHIFFKENKNIKNNKIFFNRIIINPFNFYKIHTENIYKKYVLNKNNYKIILKEYDNYINLKYNFDKDFNLNNVFLLQI